jgi:hypothetical protein
MTLDPKALEKAWSAYVNSSMDTAHFAIDAVSAAITAYLAATKVTAPDPAPVSGWRTVPVEPTPEMMRHFAGLPLEALGWARQARERAAYAAMLASAPEPPVSDGFPREHVTRKFICDGCPDLKTKNWTFEGENDDYDSGTSAFCGDRSLSAYWRKNEAVPKWCPRLPAPPKQQEPK